MQAQKIQKPTSQRIQEMKLSSSDIKKFLIFSQTLGNRKPQKKNVLNFRKRKPKKASNIFRNEALYFSVQAQKCLIFQETETLKKLLTSLKRKLFLYFGKQKPQNRTFLYFWRAFQSPKNQNLLYFSKKS